MKSLVFVLLVAISISNRILCEPSHIHRYGYRKAIDEASIDKNSITTELNDATTTATTPFVDIYNTTAQNENTYITITQSTEVPLTQENQTTCECGLMRTQIHIYDISNLIANITLKKPAFPATNVPRMKRCRVICQDAIKEPHLHDLQQKACFMMNTERFVTGFLYSKPCGWNHNWSFTGFAVPGALCCENQQIVTCDFLADP